MRQKGNRVAHRFQLFAALLAAVSLALALAATAHGEEQHAGLPNALATRGWVELPPEVIDVRYSGPTTAAAPGAARLRFALFRASGRSTSARVDVQLGPPTLVHS